ncbi:unnamed protein product, partial [Rotaria socialis]
MIALLELNEEGYYVLPFSRRVVDVGLLPWPRVPGVIPPDGYTDCGCIG